MKNAKLKSMIITASICSLVFTGCGTRSQISKNYPNNTKTPYTADNSMSGEKDQTAIKNLYSRTLKQLVTAKTITQAQSNKVLSQLTQNMSQNQMGTPNQDQMGTPNQNQMGTPNQNQMGTPNPGQMGTPNQGQMGTYNKNQSDIGNQYQTGTPDGTSSNNMGLSSLVKSKVITQAQANTIMQKIQAVMKDMKNK